MSDKLELLLKGGHVIDPANGVDSIGDLGIKDGRIARLEAQIPAAEAEHVVDVSHLLVTPGLVDIHVHCYATRPVEQRGGIVSLQADAHFLKGGVTTCVDAGTAGADEFEHFRQTIIEKSTCRILAFLNISAPGMGSEVWGIDPEQEVDNLDPRRAAEVAQAHREVVVGIKSAHYWTQKPFDAQHPPWASVDRAVEAGTRCGLPVMVDFWPRPPERPYPELILRHLRPGDIHTHLFARQFPILDGAGKVHDYLFAARERGIYFDLGHGAASFWFRNAVRALADGFPPDTLSTDLHRGNINGPVHTLLDTLSKYLAMGMPLPEVIHRATAIPARTIGHPELGTLSPGSEADVAVLALREGNFSFRDCGWARIDGRHCLECLLTLRAGQVVWDRHGLTSPRWQEVPPDSGYWEVTEVPVPVPRLWR